jgi:hypothetical protein
MTDAETPRVDCCENPDYESQKQCALCEKPACKNCRSFVNRQRICPTCRDQIESELQAEQAETARLPMAVAGGIAGSVIGGVIWAVIAALTNLEVGYVAIGVGWLAGMGTVLGAGGKKGPQLQVVAVLCSVLGLLLGKYFTLVQAIKAEYPEAAELSWFDGRFLQIFTEYFGEFVSGFDILWLVLALGIAWTVPRATQVAMTRRR